MWWKSKGMVMEDICTGLYGHNHIPSAWKICYMCPSPNQLVAYMLAEAHLSEIVAAQMGSLGGTRGAVSFVMLML